MLYSFTLIILLGSTFGVKQGMKVILVFLSKQSHHSYSSCNARPRAYWLTSASPPATRSPWWSQQGVRVPRSVGRLTVFATNTVTWLQHSPQVWTKKEKIFKIFHWPSPPPPQCPRPAWWWCLTASSQGCRGPWGGSARAERSAWLCWWSPRRRTSSRRPPRRSCPPSRSSPCRPPG